MNLPNINHDHDYYKYWYTSGVENGTCVPDEWQSTLMNLVEQAENEGVFYTVDLMRWMKTNADFIPVEWWDLQYLPPHTEVEHGIMGMEVYSARCAIREKKEREADQLALQNIEVGQSFGSMSVNRKRVNKCVVKSIINNTVTFTGVTGRYGCEFWTNARNVQPMIEDAVKRGWRKS
jgi:hypothetical protein